MAADDAGWDFLTEAANVFLARRGEVFGHTSLGLELPVYSWLTGTVVHLTGNLRKVSKTWGDPVLRRTEVNDITLN